MTAPTSIARHRRVSTWTVVSRMSRRFLPHRWAVAGSLTLVLTAVALDVAGPLLLEHLLTTALPHRDLDLLAWLCGLMVAANVLGALLSVAEVALTNRTGLHVTAELRQEIYDKSAAQPLDFYVEHGESQIQARLVSDVEGVDRFLTNTAQEVLSAVANLLAAGIAMLVLSWQLALASLGLGLGLSLLNNRFAVRRRALFSARQQLVTSMLRTVSEDLSLGGVVLGRTLCRTPWQRARFSELAEELRVVTFRQRMAGASALALTGCCFAMIPPMIYWVGGAVLPDVSIGVLLVLVILQLRTTGPMQSLLQLSATLQASVAMFERILEFLDLRRQVGPPAEARGVPAVQALRLRGIGHAYPGSARAVLRGADLRLTAGSCTFIVGPSGSGKSTLGLVLAGLLTPTAGRVEIEGAGPITDAELRSLVTLMPQHTVLFDGSILDNLLFARPQATPGEIRNVLLAAGLAGFVGAEDTQVGSGGQRLSGGERQRLALARAMLTRSRVLVVDEGTSALDQETADRVYRTLRDYCEDKALVFITHRMPQTRPGDRVLTLSQGRLADLGAPQVLAGSGPRGAHLR